MDWSVLVPKVVLVRAVAAFLSIPARICSPRLIASGVIGKSALRMWIVVASWVAPAPKISCKVGSAKVSICGLPSYDAQCADRGHHSDMSNQTLGLVDANIATVGSGLQCGKSEG